MGDTPDHRRAGVCAGKARRIPALALAFTLLCVAQPPAPVAAIPEYAAEWSAGDPHWSVLTNHLTWCHLALSERYAAARLDTNLVHKPQFVNPTADYEALAACVDLAATNYVCHTNVGVDGTFNEHLAMECPRPPPYERYHEHTNEFPLFTASDMHVAAGFTNWGDGIALRSWVSDGSRVLARRVAQAILTLKWTATTGSYSNRMTIYKPSRKLYRTCSNGSGTGYPESVAPPPVPESEKTTILLGGVPVRYATNPTSIEEYGVWNSGGSTIVDWYCRQFTIASRASVAWASPDWLWGTVNIEFDDWCTVAEGYKSDVTVNVRPPIATTRVTAEAYCSFERNQSHHAPTQFFSTDLGGYWNELPFNMGSNWITRNPCGAIMYWPYSSNSVERIADYLEIGPFDSFRNSTREWVPGWFGVSGCMALPVGDFPPVYTAGTHRVFGSTSGTGLSLSVPPAEPVPFPDALSRSDSGSSSASLMFTAYSIPDALPPPYGPTPPYFTDPDYVVSLDAETTYEVRSSPAFRIRTTFFDTGPKVLLKWQFILDTPPPLDAGAPPMPDTDRDGIVNTPLPLSDLAARCGGVLGWTVEQAEPCLVLPVTQPVGWFAGLPVHGYLTATRVLPYQYKDGWTRSRDGDNLAYSLNTRVIECGAASDPAGKRALVLRPNGSAVTFEFAPLGGGLFSPLGVPTGEHRFRSYVLEDVTWGMNSDLEFILRFEDGTMHVFGGDGRLNSVSHVNGKTTGLAWDEKKVAVPGTCGWVAMSNGCPVSASNGWFNAVNLEWSAHTNRLLGVRYTPDGAAVQTVSATISGGRAESLAKSLFAESAATLRGSTLEYGSGLTVTRTVSGDTVNLVRNTPLWGTFTETFKTNADGRVALHTMAVGGSTATTKWTYDPDSGRYPTNQLLKSSRVSRVEHPDGSAADFWYDPDTGWVTGTVAAVGNGSVRCTLNAYGSTVPYNLVERPRIVVEKYDTNVVGLTYYDYYVDSDLFIHRCPDASAVRGAASNLVSSLWFYSANNWWNFDTEFHADLLGQVVSGSEPGESMSARHSLVGNELVSVSWDSKGMRATNRYFACGVPRLSATLENGVLVGLVSNEVDEFGRLLVSSNGIEGTFTENGTWGPCGPARVRESDGSVSTMTYFPAGGLRKFEQPALGLTTTRECDPLGNVTKTTVAGDGKVRVTEEKFDAQGRPTLAKDPVGQTTFIYEAMPFGRRVTELRTGHGDVVREYYHDGSPKFEGGLGAGVTLNWEYGVSNGLYHVKELRGPATNQQWVLTRRNMLGQVVEVRRSGATNATILAYDGNGRLSAERDPTGVTTVYEYNASNRLERAGTDRNGNLRLDAASGDRIVTCVREVTTNGIGSQMWACPTDGSAEAVLLGCSTNAVDGRSGLAVRAGVTSSWSSTRWQPGGAYTNVTAYPDGRRHEAVFSRWRLKESRTIETNGVVTETVVHQNHVLGYTERTEHSRRGATVLGYNAAFQRESVTEPGLAAASFTEYWSGTGRKKREVRTDGSIVRYGYWPNGRLNYTWDTGAYPFEQEFGEDGNRTRMRTFRAGMPVVTYWDRDPATGYLARKRLQGLPAPIETYAHRDDGQLASITDIRGIVRTFSYDPTTGERTGVTVNDGITKPLTYAYDRLGRGKLAAFTGGISETFGWTLAGQLASNTVSGAGEVPDVEFAYRYSADHGGITRQRTTFMGELPAETAYWYDGGARMAVMSNQVGELVCVYVPGSDLLAAQTFYRRGVPKLTRTIHWDLFRDLPTGIVYRVDGAVVASFACGYQTNANRVAKFTLSDGTYWVYGYDPIGQLKTAERFLADGTPYLGGRFVYRYDEIGNLVGGGRAGPGGEPRHAFECNDLNAHVTRNWSNVFDVAGTAVTGVTVSVNDQSALRQGERWLCELAVDNTAGSVHTSLVVRAVRAEETADRVAETRGRAYFPRAAEPVAADAAGEIASDSRYIYGFDGNWRLVSLTSTVADPAFRLTFGYYADGRRAWKKVEHWRDGGWRLQRRHRFTWDRWVLVRETVDDYTAVPALLAVRTYVWALDLAGRTSGKLGQAAGGIDGLVAVSVVTNGVTSLYLPVLDHQGTVRHVVDAATGRIVAGFDYTPYGEVVAESGDPAAIEAVPFRFQTKYCDRESGLLYFGHRYYVPSTGKWLTRDPLGEEGGLNLTQSFGGDPVNGVDALGLVNVVVSGTDGTRFFSKDVSNDKSVTSYFDFAGVYYFGEKNFKSVGSFMTAGGTFLRKTWTMPFSLVSDLVRPVFNNPLHPIDYVCNFASGEATTVKNLARPNFYTHDVQSNGGKIKDMIVESQDDRDVLMGHSQGVALISYGLLEASRSQTVKRNKTIKLVLMAPKMGADWLEGSLAEIKKNQPGWKVDVLIIGNRWDNSIPCGTKWGYFAESDPLTKRVETQDSDGATSVEIVPREGVHYGRGFPLNRKSAYWTTYEFENQKDPHSSFLHTGLFPDAVGAISELSDRTSVTLRNRILTFIQP